MKTILSLALALSTAGAFAAGLDQNYNGLSDVYDFIYFGAYPPAPYSDADGDRVSNLDEMFWGTNPTNAASRVTGPTVALTGRDLRLSWPPAPYRLYQLEGSTDLRAWETVASGAVSNYVERLDPPGTHARKFFRLQVSLPASATGGPRLAASRSDRNLVLEWVAVSNQVHELQASLDLAAWQTLATNAHSPHIVSLSAPGLPPQRFYRLKTTGGSTTGLEPWEEALYTQALGHPLDPTTDTDGDGLPDAQEFPEGRNAAKKDHPAVGLVVFTPLEK